MVNKMELKVMTFNLRVFVPQDGENAWPYRVDKVSKMILDHSPLIVGTQEGALFMLEGLEKRLPAYRWTGKGRRGGMEDEFCAIFYRYDELEIVDEGQFWLSETPEEPGSISWNSDFPRICTWTHFRVKKSGQEFIHYNTHLDHISQEARENGIQLIWERISKHYEEKKLPIILTGDFNSKPDNQVVQFLRGEIASSKAMLKDSYSVLEGDIGRTYHHEFSGGTSGEPIDYIFTTPNVEIVKTVVDRRKIEEAFPSDHYPVVSTLLIENKY
ncbi:endonuclease/exonuclease/phosphatase family protein [Sutcliffiella sp. NC1]|uniref:endonuclease/exonuclease/phosphatase family protein n=1 Tax=Sutcliffiella sp. NC1 TaxID=3004096 RepID=UPI0022DD6687|nr:endonuclease/exonuclease/phosphatase family protein [Sutcliffiella sp. NC1]WBL14650.1 endonuclease/exonuclease/phosphatase family protein [Sutcliffiella sp. NC1]